jgi:hypothetical protein
VASLGSYCYVCRSGYRGSSSVHLSTAKHRKATRGPRLDRSTLNAALGYARVNVRRAIAGDAAYDDGVERVKMHRRRRPNDGPRRSVKVVRYYRRKVDRRRSFSAWR